MLYHETVVLLITVLYLLLGLGGVTVIRICATTVWEFGDHTPAIPFPFPSPSLPLQAKRPPLYASVWEFFPRDRIKL